MPSLALLVMSEESAEDELQVGRCAFDIFFAIQLAEYTYHS